MLRNVISPEQMLLFIEKSKNLLHPLSEMQRLKFASSYQNFITQFDCFTKEDMQLIFIAHALTIEAEFAGCSKIEDFENALKKLIDL